MSPIFWVLAWIFLFHWIGDFVAQSDEMAINKSKSVWWLTKHVTAYSLAMIPVVLIDEHMWRQSHHMHHSIWYFPSSVIDWVFNMQYMHPFQYSLMFVGVWFVAVFVTHWITDFFTSKVSAWLYPKSRHYFFVWIGLDQLIHAWTLLALYWYIIW